MNDQDALKILSREKEAVQSKLQDTSDSDGYVSPDGMIRASDYVDACSYVLEILHERIMQDVKRGINRFDLKRPRPMTIAELHQYYDAERGPVWISFGYIVWPAILDMDDNGVVAIWANSEDGILHEESYGVTWTAYLTRREAEEAIQ